MRKRGRIFFLPLSILVPLSMTSLPLKQYYGIGLEWFLGLGIVLGYEMGTYVTPDWDIMGATKDEGRMVNEIKIFGHFLYGISSTYGSIFRRHHRSFLTHFPFISTAIRYLFIFWWLFYELYWSTWDLAWLVFILIGMFVGTSLADGIHYWADMVAYPKSE